ncbi:MAG: pyridoxamine 5'-phosphate oxidase family protein [Synergistaceae bacterium]|jgi:nitroimidazol reductase NimA-like FMN-containing flavoprotein (pyridoxamine 5'-phosphate oxidase superfamily)|nr:pyridoxamine 5'-phosphate oxidase family protein [Synergistaceae bacterium]
MGLDREMRRADKKVSDDAWIADVLRAGQVIHLALATRCGEPYVVPMGYGYDGAAIYLHGARHGLKCDIIADNPKVSFNVTAGVELERSELGADFSMKYKSVTGFGEVTEITDLDGKNAALGVLMRQYDGPHSDLTEANKDSIWVARIDIMSVTGKISGYPKPPSQVTRASS